MLARTRSHGLLAPAIIIIISKALLLAFITQSIPATSAMAIANATHTPTLFDLPTRIDDDDLLQEYGRFMLSSMNQSINPCEDFYEYACGNWKHAEMVPPKSRNDSFLHAIQNKVDEMMDAFLKNATQEELKLGTAESKAKMFYTSCVQMNKNMSLGYKHFLEMEEFREPLQSQPDQNKTVDWISANFISRYAMYPLIPLKVHYNTETRRFEIYLSPPVKILSNPDAVDVKNLTRDFKIEGTEEQKQFSEQLLQMQQFEQNLTSYANRRNETEALPLTVFLVQHKRDQFNWTRYFDVAFNGTARQEWMVRNTLADVTSLVKFLNKTDLATLQNYVKWRTLIKFYYIWKAEVGDKTVESTCREHTEQYFNYALIPWFIDAAYDVDRRADILLLAKFIKQTFYDLIDKYTWLDEETKSNAKTKLKAMDVLVGYSDDMRHREVINQVYADINTTADWFTDLQVLEANRARVRMRSVHKALIPPLMSTRDVNAYYADFLNLAFVAIGISQLPFYHIKFPPALKFGGIGNIIGHEMAHGFDSYCYQFNYDGKKQNWWTEASLRNFKERYRCLESQYNKFIFRGVPTNGTLTSGDNIADNVGIRIAYYAYMKSFGQRDGELKPIPGLSFNNKQLFFLKFAQTWCTGKDDAYKMRRMKTDAHAYEEFRVTGTLSNMPEFSEVYQCKLGTDMNPLKKCVVW